MGWVSFLEDISDRLTDDLHRFREALENPSISSAESLQRSRALLSACEAVLANIEKPLELATDPLFDMAYEISELDREKAKLESDIADMSKRRDRIADELDLLKADRTALRLEKRRLELEKAAEEREWNERLAVNLEAAYELYSPPDQETTYEPDR
ncbi:MAG: hypothetical protein P1T08_16200 [Acidimicrobiia bacterium]|nr:hypothetical protein [Acidimicrobiia bacterium]